MLKLLFGASLLCAMTKYAFGLERWIFYMDLSIKGIKNEGTKDYVLVRWWMDNMEIDRKQINGLTPGGASRRNFECNSDWEPDSIEVHVEGDDSMMIDRAWLKHYTTASGWSMHTQWGRNNGRGWCLSEDPSDINSDWRSKADQCAPGVKFVKGNGISLPGKANYLSKHDYDWTEQYCIDYETRGVRFGDTQDRVVWTFMNKDNSVIEKTELSDFRVEGGGWNLCRDIVTDVPIASFRVEIKGSDALMIDRVRKARWGKKIVDDHVHYWGANNNRGWCLSTDPRDADGSWSNHADGCHACIIFRDDGSVISC